MKISVQLRSIVRRICLPLLASIAVSPALWAATITVNSTADTAANDGVCTLREAITAANTNIASGVLAGECIAGSAAGVDDIVFNIVGAGVKLITPATQLPLITTPVHINGYTQPGASANSLVAAAGSNAVFLIEIDNGGTPNAATLTVSGASAANSIIEGLALSRSANASCCANMGVYVTATSNVWIRGNLLGSDASGTVAKRFQDRAIYVDSNNDGVIIGSSTAALTPAYRNVVVAAGIGITSSGTANNITIRGNFVGTQPSGLTAISAGAVDIGIWLDNATGASVVSDNVIAGTGSRGIQTRFSNGALIERNLVGVAANGSTALGGNVSGGIVVSETTGAPLTNLTIRNNTVAYGSGIGVMVALGTVTNVVRGVVISQNVIRNNTGLGIDISASFSADGVTANDALDVDSGANNLQNFPVLATATGDGVNVATPYTFNSEPNQNFVLEFFRSAICHSSNHGGAEVYLGAANVTTDASGNAVGTASFASALVTGFISATATHAVNGTSEFSSCATLNAPVSNVLLTVTKSGTGAGTVTGTGIACGADCSESVALNTVVALTATAAAGSTFIGWSGGGCSGAGACSVTMGAAQTVNAQFDLAVAPTFLLSVTKSGTGSGTVTGTGIACGLDCSESVAPNTVVALTAAVTAGSTFVGWSGGGCSGTTACNVTVTAATTINAQFDITPIAAVTLTVTKSGTGSGTITGTGINCGADCSEPFALGTVVTLTATATAGSTFIGWSGGGCSGTATCNVTMSAAQTVNAQFDLAVVPTFLLTVSKSGTGSGTVTGVGISCGGDCTEPFAQNTVVVLTATPAAGSTFAGWSGAGCSGVLTCSVIVSATATVTAQFNFVPAQEPVAAVTVPTLNPMLLLLLATILALMAAAMSRARKSA